MALYASLFLPANLACEFHGLGSALDHSSQGRALSRSSLMLLPAKEGSFPWGGAKTPKEIAKNHPSLLPSPTETGEMPVVMKKSTDHNKPSPASQGENFSPG